MIRFKSRPFVGSAGARLRSHRMGPFLLLFSIPFIAVGLGVLTYGIVCWHRYVVTKDWPLVTALIESVNFVSDSSGESTTYHVECRYKYSVNGQEYAGTRVTIMGGGDSDSSYHRRHYELLEQHRTSGRPFPALVNPEKPEKSFLFRDANAWLYVLPLFGLVFAGAGCGMCCLGMHFVRAARREKAGEREYGDRLWLYRADWRNRRAKANGGGLLVLLWAFGLGLPCFVSIFIILFLSDASAPFFARAIVMVFVAFALAVLAAAIYRTVQHLTAPHSELVFRDVPMHPGEKMIAVLEIKGCIPACKAIRGRWTCTRYVEGDEHVTPLRKESLTLDATLARRDMGVTLVPIELDLPADLPACNGMPGAKVEWKIVLRLPAFPSAYPMTFDLPVFGATGESKAAVAS